MLTWNTGFSLRWSTAEEHQAAPARFIRSHLHFPVRINNSGKLGRVILRWPSPTWIRQNTYHNILKDNFLLFCGEVCMRLRVRSAFLPDVIQKLGLMLQPACRGQSRCLVCHKLLTGSLDISIYHFYPLLSHRPWRLFLFPLGADGAQPVEDSGSLVQHKASSQESAIFFFFVLRSCLIRSEEVTESSEALSLWCTHNPTSDPRSCSALQWLFTRSLWAFGWYFCSFITWRADKRRLKRQDLLAEVDLVVNTVLWI